MSQKPAPFPAQSRPPSLHSNSASSASPTCPPRATPQFCPRAEARERLRRLTGLTTLDRMAVLTLRSALEHDTTPALMAALQRSQGSIYRYCRHMSDLIGVNGVEEAITLVETARSSWFKRMTSLTIPTAAPRKPSPGGKK